MGQETDPREVLQLDVHDIVTSDEDEDTKIKQQLDELERQQRDLRDRLEQKASRKKAQRQSLERVEVPASPKEERKSKASPQSQKSSKGITLAANSNNDSIEVPWKNGPSNTTSYFVENFVNARKVEEQKIQHRSSLLSCRVHTFKGIDSLKGSQPVNVDEKELYSGFNISRRYMSTSELDEIMREIKVLRLPKLFSKVRPPKFTEPDYANWVAIGIISFKSEVKLTSSSKPSKYFKMTLTDFTHNLDIYIFNNKNVEKYYNLRVGDIIAILNPDILPWRPSQVNNDEFSGPVVKSFNLSIRHNFDCVLEIGTSKDLGFCRIPNKATRKACGAPINRAATDRCEYHQDVRFRHVNAQRVELNGSTSLRSPVKNGKKQALYGTSGVKRKLQLLPDKHAPQAQDGESQNTLFFSNPNYAKAFFDDSYQNPDMLNNLENKRRKLKDSEKERTLQNQLNSAIGKTGYQSFNNKSKEEQKQMKDATEQVLNSGLLRDIGFDPFRGKMREVLKFGKNVNSGLNSKSSQVKEIMSFKKSNVSLAPSKAEQKKRLLRREQVWREHFDTEKLANQKQKKTPSSESSDSDLEIV
ncbi:Mcm10p [Lachancea thermotolerans CBS 6340]|uniref:KLTH0E01034p n=1 Tax=Lachancea thermotolerans (strain ATCC 56472 / CBS 6340 / NRRL Y-8284) TaxID=559295 RepID=C5DH35_LACTC|nr:KLTH0E01034p [Lachancea thermotolerans CBS 6340]CAR23096.1 KLTH0E01034p [Lachancea thermotolerans CBS 6340]